ncbi:MAG: PilZ domain-containing protein [Negativicutes bacterium]|nr:PilZ domain-containing protein [Negativicutes bacterium]
MADAEKRGFIRIKVDFSVTLEADDGPPDKSWTAEVLNVSLDGMLLKSEAALPLDMPLQVQFPSEWGGFRVAAAIVRQDGVYHGSKYLDMGQETRQALDQLIYRLWRRSTLAGSLHI